jgi:hypothetical protein
MIGLCRLFEGEVDFKERAKELQEVVQKRRTLDPAAVEAAPLIG